ncbi:DHHW family protein [Clostridium sp. HMP27]|uniref:DHHW family protein n=1 Tax=Clostridium sp. HMP27 TaxID=1487921 RepID=UPI00052D3CC5|nr:DHHW family protein [Clostridium sp. HMP27]KGK86475.1 hypothetical protein DP68_13485 [Clostridium sp. HMP27]
MKKYKNVYKCVLGAFVFLYIVVILASNIVTADKNFSDSENRTLQQKPKFSMDRLIEGKYTSNYEKYISDQFVGRDFWIGVKSATEKLLGKTENNDVYLGKDGYLFQKFEKPNIKNLENKLNTINNFALNNKDTHVYFMLAPNSTRILEDRLPSYASPADQRDYINQVNHGLGKDIKFVDVFDTMNSNKDKYIYYKTDHHWTTEGAFYAYEDLGKYMGYSPLKKEDFKITKVSDEFYGTLYSRSGFRNIKPDTIEVYTPKEETHYKVWYSDEKKERDSFLHLENANKKDKYTVFFNSNHPLVKIQTGVNNHKRLLVIKDSYANSLVPFLTNHYSEIYMVDPRYYTDSITDLAKANSVDDILLLYNVNTFSEDASINTIR